MPTLVEGRPTTGAAQSRQRCSHGCRQNRFCVCCPPREFPCRGGARNVPDASLLGAIVASRGRQSLPRRLAVLGNEQSRRYACPV